MAIPALALAVGSKVIGKVVEAVIASLLSEKVIIRVAVKLLDKAFKSTKNTLDDAIWKDVRCDLLNQVGEKDKDCN